MMGFGIGRMGLAFRGPRPVPSWVAPGAAFHIKPASGWGWINGREYTSFSALVADPTAASFSRPSECYALTSAGTFTRFDSGVPAITDLGLLVEGEETALDVYSHTPLGWGSGTRVTKSDMQLGPLGATASLITANGVSGSHSIGSGVYSYTFGTRYLVYAIIGQLSSGYFQLVSPSAAFGVQTYSNFDLSGNGSTATKGANIISSGVVKLSSGWFLCWHTALATANGAGSTTMAFVPAGNSARLVSSTSTASAIFAAYQVSTGLRWGSPIATQLIVPVVRSSVVFTIFPQLGSYSVEIKFRDGTSDQMLSDQIVTVDGWRCPTVLDGRFVAEIIGRTT